MRYINTITITITKRARFLEVQQHLLENEEVVLKMKFIIINAKEKYKDVTDARTFWEMVKMEIRIFDQRTQKWE